MGPYSGSKLVLANLGLQLKYESEMKVALLGRLLCHGITEAVSSRICLAQFMRDNVLERSGIPAPDWMTLEKLGGP